MGRIRRVTRATRARAGITFGAVLIGVGTLLIAGIGWALVVVGTIALISFAVGYDVDEPTDPVATDDPRTGIALEAWREEP